MRPIVCLIKSKEHDGLYWAIPMGKLNHRDDAGQKRFDFYLTLPERDIRSCYYHIVPMPYKDKQSLWFHIFHTAFRNSSLIPIMFLITVQRVNLRHFILRQFKIEQFGIFLNVVRIAGARYDHHTFLQVPPQDYLSR